ncbi:MAG TPA: MFS transporter [Gammaproteobacteria bacterium]
MAAVGFISVALVFGAPTAALPFVYSAVVDEFGWSLTEATLLFTYKNVASASAALFLLGPILRRFGLRRLMVGAFIGTGLGMTAFLAVDTLPSYYVAGILLGLGSAAAMVGTNVFVSRWFFRNQGLAVGLTLTGASAGGVVFPVLTVELIDAAGWRAAVASLSLFIWLVALPIYLWKAKEEPSAEDLEPEIGAADGAAVASPRPAGRDAPLVDARGLGAICRTKQFWMITLALLCVAAADAAMVQHTPLLLSARADMSAGIVAVGMSAMFAFGIVGKVAAGRLYDACSVKGMSLWNVLVAVSVALVLPVAGITTLFAFAIVRGLAHGGLVPKPAVLAKHCYGAPLVSTVLPVLMGTWLLGAGIGPVVLAMLFDATGHYRHGILLLVTLSLLASVLLTAVRSEHRPYAP